ncbi:SseB family protein [Aliiruegeria sabulilitoris]|uniref:SseB family protein n=1 Tax=Aliiruegeria sabulilitoris TaxID=1510458 RepID=UPI00082A52D2|nr:SseB family protein [Aliiruegeria sabulilitoris]NDR59420.1 SseB family protein [Pseudoruegeria sp. M32A2M]
MSDETTPLDAAHAAMMAAPEDGAARLRFYERLADSELFLLLEKEAEDDSIAPQLFPLEDGSVVLVFDRESRLGDFLGKPAHFAALSGRQAVKLLAGQGIGLGVNLGTEGSEIVLPAEAVDWLAQTLEHAPQQAEERPDELLPPGNVPEALLAGLDTKLATAAGLARLVYLAGVRYESGRQTHMLAFVDAVPGAENALATAASEALTFSGLEAGEMDVAFFAANDPITARLARVGLRFELPEPPKHEITEISPPGMDPDAPPILK